VVEWGEGKVEDLTDDRLQVVIHRAVGDTTDEPAPAGTGPGGGRARRHVAGGPPSSPAGVL
ncbi:hypothetical protein ACWEQM_07090, partial [Streptomyces nodosus]